MSAAGRLPLSNVRIIEVGHMLAGPYCGMLLADLGAEVVKIEVPGGGDIARSIGPHSVGPHNTYFASLNRNKKSVVIDLASDSGRRDFHRMIEKSDGLLTNLRPSAIKKLGLTFESLRNVNPKIACLALTGYGLDGPFADKPAYDYVIQALAGVMALTGDPTGPPTKTGFSVVDNSAGIMGALGLLAAIHSGRGGQVDVSMYDTMLSQLNYLASAFMNGAEKPVRQKSGAHPYVVPAQIFDSADGHLALFVTHDEFWRQLALEAGIPHWQSDPKFSTMKGRSANRALVISEVAKVMGTDSTESWVSRLTKRGIVAAGVQTLEQALESPLTAHREMIVHLPTPDGDLHLLGSPFKFPGCPPQYSLPPMLGEHNDILFEGIDVLGRVRLENSGWRER